MKTKTNAFFSIIAVLSLVLFSSCSKDDDFDYSKDMLVGTWKMTHAQVNSVYVDITAYPYSSVFDPTYATFKSNGDYSGSGEFGTGSGTYTALGKTITCFVGGKEYVKYVIIALSDKNCELEMLMGDSSMKIKCVKQ